jgi:dTMP kinase
MSLKRGVLLVIEGIDGAGKTTQADRLYEFLVNEGYDACRLAEPSNGTWGAQIRRAASEDKKRRDPEDEYRLFVLDRKENVEKNIGPALAQKRVVIMDRYYLSTMAYQGARDIDPERIRRENEAFAPIPDLVFYLCLSIDEGLTRIAQSRTAFTSFEQKSSLTKVKAIFDTYAARLSFVVTVDGTLSEDAIFDTIRDRVAALLSAISSR